MDKKVPLEWNSAVSEENLEFVSCTYNSSIKKEKKCKHYMLILILISTYTLEGIISSECFFWTAFDPRNKLHIYDEDKGNQRCYEEEK